MPAGTDLYEGQRYRDGNGYIFEEWDDGRVAMSVGWDYGQNGRDHAYNGFVVVAEPITRQLIIHGRDNYEIIPVERWLYVDNGRKILEAAIKEVSENPGFYGDTVIIL